MAAIENLEGISVFVKINGEFCLAPIATESAEIFIGMIAAFQSGTPRETRLIRLPADVAKHVQAAGRAIGSAVDAARAKEQPHDR